MSEARRVWTIISPEGVTFTADAPSVVLHQPMIEIAECDDPQAPLERVPDGPLQFWAALNAAGCDKKPPRPAPAPQVALGPMAGEWSCPGMDRD